MCLFFCSKLSDNAITSISSGAFNNLNKIGELYVRSSIEWWRSQYGSFFELRTLTSNPLKVIQGSAFNGLFSVQTLFADLIFTQIWIYVKILIFQIVGKSHCQCHNRSIGLRRIFQQYQDVCYSLLLEELKFASFHCLAISVALMCGCCPVRHFQGESRLSRLGCSYVRTCSLSVFKWVYVTLVADRVFSPTHASVWESCVLILLISWWVWRFLQHMLASNNVEWLHRVLFQATSTRSATSRALRVCFYQNRYARTSNS